MFAIDTNVLVRFVTRDDERQAQKAAKLLSTATQEQPVLITAVVMVELVWTLARVYRYTRDQIALGIKPIVMAGNVRLQHAAEVRAAFDQFQVGKEDFADVLIGLLGKDLGAATTYTFDKKAAKSDYFTAL